MLRGDIYAVKSSITSALLADPEIPAEPSALPCPFCGPDKPGNALTVSLDGEWNFRYAENLTAPFTDWEYPDLCRLYPRCRACKAGQALRHAHYVNTQ